MASRLFTKTLTIRLALVITTKRAVSSIRPLSSLTIKFGGATIPGVSHAVSTTNNCPTTGDKTPSAAMGRSGYDTSSMKMAARPRPAATKVGSALGGGEKGNGTKKPSSESSDVVGQGTEKASGKSRLPREPQISGFTCSRAHKKWASS